MNRGPFIGDTLDSILSQAGDETEVVILDGASTDNTREVVEHYSRNHKNIKYVYQDKACGVDRDFSHTVELASGKYCWMMCDDDFLKPGAIKTVLEHIKDDYGLILVNSEVRDPQMGAVIHEKILDISEDGAYEPKDNQAFFVDNANYLSFIGCVVIKKEIWDRRDKEPFFGTEFVHVGVIFQKLLQENILVVSTPYIAIRAGNAQWTPKGFDIWFYKWPRLIWSFDGYPEEAKAKICHKEPYRKVISLLHARAQGALTREVLQNFRSKNNLDVSETKLMDFISVLPGTLINCMGMLYFKFVNKSGLGLFYLKNSKCYYKNILNKKS